MTRGRRWGGRLAILSVLLLLAGPVLGAPWWDAHFTAQVSNGNSVYEQAIETFINQATQSVWVTSFTWGNSSNNGLVNALNSQYGAGLDIRIVGDNGDPFNTYMGNYEKRNDAAYVTPDDLMHNKFIVLDYGTANARVMTGSTNWTDPAYQTQNNDIISINDATLADIYGREFLELWGNHYREGPVDNHDLTISGHSVKVYFAPEDDPGETYLTTLLNNALRSIYFLSFNHRLSDHTTAVIAVKNRGGVGEGVYESIYAEMLASYQAAGSDVRYKANTDRMHHKLWIIDLVTVVTGSLNDSNVSSSYTDENMLVVNDFRLAREYMKNFHFVMDQATPQVGSPTHEDNAPAVVAGLAAVDTPNDAGGSISVSWTANNESDLAGYYVYVERSAITSTQNLIPEYFVQTGQSCFATTINQDDLIANNTNYYIAVAAVDLHGNENYNAATVGPVQASGVITGSRPSGSIDFDTTSSVIAGQTGLLLATVSNDPTGVSAIRSVMFDFGDSSQGLAFSPLAAALQNPPAGWFITGVTGTTITFTSNGAATDIVPGGSMQFYIAVTNPTTGGVSNPIILTATAANSEVAAPVTISTGLTVTSPAAVPNATLAWDTGASQRGGNNSAVVVYVGNGVSASAAIRQVIVTFGTAIDAFVPRGSSVQIPPAGWTVSVAGDVATYDATAAAYYLNPGETLPLTVQVINPGISGASASVFVTLTDANSISTTGIDAGSLAVLATDGVVINEFMYNPVGTNLYYEWVELYNSTPVTVDLSGWVLNPGGAATTIPNGTTLASYQFLVIASVLSQGSIGDIILESFALRYGDRDGVWNPLPGYALEDYTALEGTDFDLGNDADYVSLTSDDSAFYTIVYYNDALSTWQGADGVGSSFEKIDPYTADVGNPAVDGFNWRPSVYSATYPYGTPGASNGATSTGVPGVTGLGVSSVGQTSVTLYWTPITSYPSFAGYRIYYSTTSPVGNSSSFWSAADDPNLAIINTATTTITGLNANTTYYFKIVAVSSLAGVGDLGSATEVPGSTATTAVVTVRSLSDGVNYVTIYDGSRTMRDAGTTVTLATASTVSGTNAVTVWYDVGADPDGPLAGNPNDRYAIASGSGSTWDAVIPANDAEVTDRATVRFIVNIEGQNYYYSGTTWRYKIDGGVTASFTDLAAVGVGMGSVELRWTPTGTVPDFGQYRIYYSAQTGDTITVDYPNWDVTNDYQLGRVAANSTVVRGLLAGVTYRFRIVAVDHYGNESAIANSNEATATTRTGTVLITEVAPEGDSGTPSDSAWVELYCVAGSQDLTGWNVTDLDGNTEPVGAVTMTAGDYRVVYFTNAGVLGAEDQVALDVDGDTANGGYSDAVVWTDNNGAYSAAEQADVIALGTAHWQFSSFYIPGSEGTSEAFSVPYRSGYKYSLARQWAGAYADENFHLDWRRQFVPSPAAGNNLTRVTLNSFTDGTNSSGQLDGYISLQDTVVTVTFGLEQSPQDSSSVKLFYAVDATPSGDPNGSDTAVALAPVGDLLTWSGSIAGSGNAAANLGKTVNFIVTVDGVPFTYNNVPWRYKWDGAVPAGPGGLRVLGTTTTGVTLAWTPVGSTADFAGYRVYYSNTGSPTAASPYFSAAEYPSLRGVTTGGVTVGGLGAGDTWVFALAAFDAVGNLSAFSNLDTGVTRLTQGVTSLTLSDTAGNALTSSFDGTSRLRDADVTVATLFNEAPVATPLLWYDAGEAPDGPGGTNPADRSVAMTNAGDPRLWTAILPASDADVVHDTIIQLLYSINGTVFDNNGSPFKYKVDEVSGPGLMLAGTGTDSTTTTVTISWIPGSYPQFGVFRVYYAQGITVTTAGSVWSTNKDATLASSGVTGTSIRGLNASDTYTFGVVWRDDVGNESPLTDTVTLYTNNMVPAADPATDGTNWAHRLDGSEALLARDLTVIMELTTAPSVPGTAGLWYDIGGGTPDGPGGANPNDRWLELTDNPDGNPYTWSTVIPLDSRMVDGAVVRYLGTMDGFFLSNGGNPYSFRIDSTPPPGVTGASVHDFGSNVVLTWSPVGPGDFAGYRIYTNTVWPARSGVRRDAAVEPALGLNATAGTTIPGLDPAANYFITIATVDAVGNETLLPEDFILYRTAPGAATAMAYVSGNAYGHGEVYSGETIALTVLLTDAAGVVAPGETVTLTITGGDGRFAGQPAATAVSGLDGRARAVLTAGLDAAVATSARAECGALGAVNFFVRGTDKAPTALRVLAPGSTADGSGTLTVEALDALGQFDAAYYGKVILTPTESAADGSFQFTSEFLLESGRGSIAVSDREVETVDLLVRDRATGLVSATATWAVTPGVPAAVRLTLSAAADAGTVIPVTAALYDAWNNACTNDNASRVQLQGTGGAYGTALVAPLPVVNGVLAATLRDLVAETVIVSAVSGALASDSAACTVVPGPAAKIAVTPSVSAIAGGNAAVRVEVRDAYGNRLLADTGRTVALAAGGSATVTPASAITAAGAADFTIHDAVAEAVTLTPAAAGLAPVSGIANFAGITPDHLTVSAPGTATCGETVSITVLIQDALGNTITDNAAAVALTVTGGTALTAGATAVAGSATVGLGSTVAGAVEFTASAAGLTSAARTITFAPAAADHLTLGGPVGATAGAGVELTVGVADRFGNLLAGDNGRTIAFTATGSAAVPATALTAAVLATVIVTDLVAENITLTAGSAGLAGASHGLAFAPGAAVRLVFTAPATLTAGETGLVTATVVDAYGNTVATDTTTVVTLSYAGTPLGSAAAQSGVATLMISRLVAGSGSLSAAAPGLTGASAALTINPAAPAAVALTAPATAAAGVTVEVAVAIRDAYGNLVTTDGNRTLDVSVTGSAIAAATATATAGLATVMISDPVAENITLTISGAGLSGAAHGVVFAPAAAARVALAAPATLTAGETATVTATVVDAYGNTVATDTTTTVTLAYAGTSLGSAAAQSGLATFMISRTAAGSGTLSVAAAGLAGASAALIVIPAAPAIIALTAPATAEAGATVEIAVAIRDACGNLVTTDGNRTLDVSVTGNAAVATQLTAASGSGLAYVTDVTAEAATVTVSGAGLTAGTATTTFLPGSGQRLNLTLAATGVCGAPVSATVTLTDTLGNIITADNSTVVTLEVTAGAATGGNATVVAGVAAIPLSATLAGAVTANVTAGALTGAARTITFAPAAAAALRLTPAAATATAGNALAVTVEVLDNYGNRVTADSGRTIALAATGAAGISAASVSSAAGAAAVTVTDPSAEAVTLTATAAGLTTATTALTWTVGGAAQLTATVPATATCGQTVTIPVRIEDAYGNLLTADNATNLSLAIQGGSATGSIATVSGGAASLNITATVAGPVVVAITNGAGLTTGNRTITFAPAAAARLALAPAASTATAGNALAVTVEVLDSYGNRVTADSGRTIALAATGAATISAASVSSAAGAAAATVTDPSAEPVTLTATAAGLTTATTSLTWTVGGAARLTATVPATATCGQTVTIPVRTEDAYGNLLTADNATNLTLAIQGGSATGSSAIVSGGAASLNITATVAGPVVVAITDGAGLTTGNRTITFAPAAAAALRLTPAAATLTAGTARAVRVEVVDTYDNLISADNGRTITLAVTGNATPTPASAATIAGAADFTVTDQTAEGVTLTATATAVTAASGTLTFTTAAPARLTATAPVSAVVGSAVTVGVRVEDAYGNLIGTDNATVITAAVSRGTVTGAGAVSGGLRSLPVTTTIPGDLTITPQGTGGLTGVPVVVSILPGAPVRVVAGAAAATLAAGSPLAVTLTVLDSYGNIVTTDNGTAVRVQLTGAAASAATATPVVVSAGTATATVTDNAAEAVTATPVATGLAVTPLTATFTAAGAAALVAALDRATLSADDTAVLTLEVRDAYGNRVSSDNATAITLALPAGMSASPALTQTVAAGRAAWSLRSDAVGSLTVTAGATGLTGAAATLAVTPGAATTVRLSPVSAATPAGSALGLTATVVDRAGNQVTAGAWPVTLVLTGSAASPQAAIAAVTVGGNAALTVTDTFAETVIATPVAPGLAGLPATLTFSPGSGQTIVLAVPAVVTAGNTLPVTVTVTDQYGNPAAVNSTVTLAADRGTLTPATFVFSGIGGASASLTVSGATGAIVLTARLDALTAAATVTVALAPTQTATVTDPVTDVAVTVPAGATPQPYSVTVQEIAGGGGVSLGGIIGSALQLTMMDAVTGDTVTGNFAALVTVEVPYADADQNGLLDGTDFDERRLQLYRWENEAWVVVADGGRNEADPLRNVVVADLRHFSEYGIRVSADTGAAGGEIFVYPNPWKPEHGAQRVVFANIPQGVSVTIKIFNIAGELIVKREITLNGIERAEWDLCNESGHDVASGVYLYVITGGGVEKIGKIAIIR